MYEPKLNKEIKPWYEDSEVGYVIPSSYFEERLYFSSALITFVSKELRRVDHRKIKVTISARPTDAFAPVLSAQKQRSRSTSFDIKFQKYIQLSLPFDNILEDAMPEENTKSPRVAIGTVNVHGAAHFGAGDINMGDIAVDLKRLLHAVAASDGESEDKVVLIEGALQGLEKGDQSKLKDSLKKGAAWIGKTAERLGLSALEAYIKAQVAT